jgi:hypothetical protein
MSTLAKEIGHNIITTHMPHREITQKDFAVETGEYHLDIYFSLERNCHC